MKIGGLKQNYNIPGPLQTGKKEKTGDLVILGQKLSEEPDLNSMKQIASIKSHSANEIALGLVLSAGVTGGMGALCSGAGMLGKSLGGIPGIVVAAGITAISGKLLLGNRGAVAAAGITVAGAALGEVSTPLALGAGVAGGIGTFIYAGLNH